MPAQASAQQQRDTARQRPDSVVVPARVSPADSLALAGADTSEEARRRADSIKPPLPRAELPMPPGSPALWRWDREALFATGALSLMELLERIPGITSFRTGWIASPQVAAYLGDPLGVRIFLDGIELAALSPRTGGGFDLAEIPLWPLDEVMVERAAGEVRVHMRTWTVRSTTPFTRTDVYTGDEDTNVYRGFFGRRFSHDEQLQLAGEQYGTAGNRFGDGDQLALLGRIGIGRARWGADAFVLRSNRTREPQAPQLGGSAISPLGARWTTAYVRAGTGDPDAGAWLQLIAASQAYRESSPQEATEPEAGADTTKSVADYVATGGVSWSHARVSIAGRARVGGGRTRYSQSARAGLQAGPLGLRMFAENGATDSVTRVEAQLDARLLGPLHVMGAAAWVNDRRGDVPREDALFGRAEVGLLIRRLWLSAGVMYRDSVTLAPATVFERGFVFADEVEAIGGLVSVRGKFWRDLGLDLAFVGWESSGWYRPQRHAIGRLYVDSRWLDRFPSGNFGINAAAQLEYRSEVPFPEESGIGVAEPSIVLSTLLEIRIVDATLTWQLRNALVSRHVLVPGFLMPGPVNLYGVRWSFWN